jgi:fatty-acyl-CoA synthase
MKVSPRCINNIRDIEDVEKVSLESHIRERTAYDVLKASAAQWPERKAFIFLPPDKPLDEPLIITYQQLFNNVNQIANLLMMCGITADKAVSYILPNIPENYFLFFAAQAVGIANPISPKLPPEQISELLQTAESEILISTGPHTNPQLWENILKARKLCPGLKKILVLEDYSDPQQNIESFYRLLKTQPISPLFDEKDINPEAVCAYFHTSGTVGTPKLVQHTHWGIMHAAWAVGIFAQYQRDNAVILSGFPMFHVSAPIAEALSALLYGASIVVMSPQGWGDSSVIAHFWKIVERYKGTSMAAVPPIYKALLQVPLKGENICSLQSALSGNVSVSKEDSDAFYAITGVRISTLWGQTEAIVGCINPSSTPSNRTFGAAGLRLPYLQMEILKTDTLGNNLQECLPQEPGTLYIKGPNVGSYKSAELNKKAFIERNWFSTGDWAYKDEDSYIWILGRQSDFILWENSHISLLAIETTLQQNPFIKKAAALSVPAQTLGERVYAFLIVDQKAEINPSTLIQQLQITLKKQFGSLPIEIEVRDSLPLNGMGKVIKYQLREELQSETEMKKVS